MRIVFMGTPDFAVPSLKALVEGGYSVVGVVTQPDRPKGRGKKLAMSPVKEYAIQQGIPVLQPERISRDGYEDLLNLHPDLCITAAFGQILSQKILDIPPLGTINVHASLLPKHRGSAPIAWAMVQGDKTTGGGLAWGGGCSPSLTPDLVMFTDNADPVKLLALDMKTGEIVASMPVLDDLPEGYQVAVENSAIVYDDSEGTVSTIVCNWFGAGSAGLADPDSDSSIQSYANIYDMNWLTKGNCMIAPGVERVDTVKTDSGYEMKSIWSRNDLSDTSILKLSTATGYIYGYVQDLESGMWQYIILDFATGETVFTMDVSNKYGYNNMAIGMYAGNSGNALYCPTGYLELLCLQDRFVYLPEMPYRKVDLDKAARNVLTQEQFEQDGGDGTVASWRNTVTVENVHPNTTVSFRMNNLSGDTAGLKLYAYGADRKLAEVGKELWSITDETGAAVDTLSDGTLYELRVSVADGSAFDLSEAEREIKISVVLAK